MTTVSQARLGKWFNEEFAKHAARGHELGWAKGWAEGWAEGVAQERARRLALLRRQAAGKFGAATAERLQALVGSDASAAQLERLGEWIIDCGSGAELLARISGHGDDDAS